MGEMTDRAAASLREHLVNKFPDKAYDCGTYLTIVGQFANDELAEMVRVVMRAMREPTDPMINAGRTLHPYDCDVAESWPVMIEEALK